MIVDIINEIFTTIKNTLTGITVLTSYPSTVPLFPCVIVEEFINTTNTETIDSSGEKYNNASIEINIFSNAKNRITEVKSIRNQIDTIMSGTYRMTRSFSNAVPNFADETIYRYTLRYDYKVNSNKQLFR